MTFASRILPPSVVLSVFLGTFAGAAPMAGIGQADPAVQSTGESATGVEKVWWRRHYWHRHYWHRHYWHRWHRW